MQTTPLRDEELEHFRRLLLEKRSETAENARMLREVGERQSGRSDQTGDLSSVPTHPADEGMDAHLQEINLDLMEQEMVLLERIDEALSRIDDKTYGLCLATGRPIARERLEAQPWARYSMEYEKGLDT